jgi:addiction module HigA family antidote
VHPGAWLCSEIIEPQGLSVIGAATRLGITCQAMSDLLGARAGLSAEIAFRFESAFGVDASMLIRMQATHDLVKSSASKGVM